MAPACAQWLNRMLQGMWPYYDKAVGVAIKEAVEPMMEQYKPPGLIKRIYFSKLTFGDAPLRIDNVWVEDEGEQHVLLEVGALYIRVLGFTRVRVSCTTWQGAYIHNIFWMCDM